MNQLQDYEDVHDVIVAVDCMAMRCTYLLGHYEADDGGILLKDQLFAEDSQRQLLHQSHVLLSYSFDWFQLKNRKTSK